ncbi:MAG: DUF2281 domain-containing protein [Acidobacteriota bacterium]|nr:DUF2281 domain-containing protein [Acidobacteriota bacterium]
MNTALQSILEKAQLLSLQKQTELLNYIEKLLNEEKPRKKTKMTFSWAGRPDDPPVELNSVELQHEATRLRIEKIEHETAD